jgi:hypothetical protein
LDDAPSTPVHVGRSASTNKPSIRSAPPQNGEGNRNRASASSQWPAPSRW